MEKLVLLDSNSLANRAFWAIPALNDSSGMPTNAIYGFVSMLLRIIEHEKPQYIAAAFDVHAPTFRHKRFDGYKATRKPMPDELRLQMPHLKELLKTMGIAVFELEGYEADDLIGTLAKKSNTKTIIYTGDKDALQLVDDKISVYLTKRGITEIEAFDQQHVFDVFGFGVDRILDYKALLGDSSDNIPGVSGIGEKTALSLVGEYGSLENLYLNLDRLTARLKDKLIQGRDSARLSYELATIDQNVPIEFSLNDLKFSLPFPNEVRGLFVKYNFMTLLKRSVFADTSTVIIDKPSKPKKEVPVLEIKEDSRYAQLRLENSRLDAARIVELRNDEMLKRIAKGQRVAIYQCEDYLGLAFDFEAEYRLIYSKSLLDLAFTIEGASCAIKDILEDETIEKVLFDYKAFRRSVERYGIAINGNYTDIQLVQYCIDCTKANSILEDTLQNMGFVDFAKTPAPAMLKFLDFAQDELEDVAYIYNKIEKPLQKVLYDMETHGFKVDTEIMNSLGNEYEKRLKELTERIYELANVRFNINSPQQLGNILFEKLKLNSSSKTKTKQLSTGIDVLLELENAHPIVPLLIRYRTLAKLNGTYIEGLRKLLTEDGILHTVFKQTVTLTGRLSSIEPNLQNIPIRDEEGRQIRRFFVSRSGRKLISADYSQIELRLLAHLSGCKRLIEAYNKNEDIHARTASDIYGIDISAITKDMRRRAKTINFGIIYGMSDFGLSKELNISKKEAHEYIEKYFNLFPEIKDYFQSVLEKTRIDGYVKTMSGRIRRISSINNSNYQVRSFSERAAMNMPLQGAAADLIKLAMLNVDRALRLSGVDARIICQVHDELILEAHNDCAERVRDILKLEMEGAGNLSVPLVADARIADNWFDL